MTGSGPSADDVDARLAARAHPLADAVDVLRAAIRAARPDAVESWKWNAPSFALHDHFATLALRRPDEVLVILHAGAKPSPEQPEIVVDDPRGLLRRAGRDRMIAAFADADQARAAAPALTAIVRAWADQLIPPARA